MDKETRMIRKLAWAIIHAGDVDYTGAPVINDGISFFPEYLYRINPVTAYPNTEVSWTEEELETFLLGRVEKEIFAHFCKIIAETLTQFNEE